MLSTPFPFLTSAKIVGPPSLWHSQQQSHYDDRAVYLVDDPPHTPSIPLHNAQIRAHSLRKINLDPQN